MTNISYTEGYDDSSVLMQIWKLDKKTDAMDPLNPYVIDDAIIEGSTNAVENRAIYNALQDKQPVGDYVTSGALDERLENYPTDQDIEVVENGLQAQIDTKQTYSTLIRRIHIGTAEVPDVSIGEDGDLYIWRP